MQQWEEHQRSVVLTFVREALAGQGDARTAKLAAALFDQPTWKAFRTRGVSSSSAAEAVATMATAVVETRKNVGMQVDHETSLRVGYVVAP